MNPSASFDNNKNIGPEVDSDEEQEDDEEDVNEEEETTEEEEMVHVPVKRKHSLKLCQLEEKYLHYPPIVPHLSFRAY